MSRKLLDNIFPRRVAFYDKERNLIGTMVPADKHIPPSERCECYCKDEYLEGYSLQGEPVYKIRHRCFGTKEKDPCTCGGDKRKCDYYREKGGAK